ncbi:MAG TPA: fatty acid desaturase family protein [Candidatus Binataceae bacterium]|nr:fatty acid desaturase family protein [Candidatus Binataceae bacterium]
MAMMFKASSVFTPDELLILKRKSDLRGGWMVFHAWAVIFAAMALFVWWPNPLTFIAAVLIIGARQLGLAILMHDAAHGLLFTSLRVNDWVGAWLLGDPLMSDMFAYRTYHVLHHRFTQQPNDPDLALAAPFPITRASFRRKVIRDLSGQTAYQQRSSAMRRAFRKTGAEMTAAAQFGQGLTRFGGFFVTNAILLAILALAGHPWLYLTLWIVPLMTFNQLITRIRSIAEHSMVPDNDDPMRNTRTTHANLLERALIAPYFVNYHLEHHLLMAVPCYNLPMAHALMLAKGLGPKMELAPGYGAVLTRAASRPAPPGLRAAA